MKRAARTKVTATDAKEALVARLMKRSSLCDETLAKLDDSKLSEQVSWAGGKTMSSRGC